MEREGKQRRVFSEKEICFECGEEIRFKPEHIIVDGMCRGCAAETIDEALAGGEDELREYREEEKK